MWTNLCSSQPKCPFVVIINSNMLHFSNHKCLFFLLAHLCISPFPSVPPYKYLKTVALFQQDDLETLVLIHFVFQSPAPLYSWHTQNLFSFFSRKNSCDFNGIELVRSSYLVTNQMIATVSHSLALLTQAPNRQEITFLLKFN